MPSRTTVVAGVAALLLATGCSSASDTPDEASDVGAATIQPGKPGQPAATVTSGGEPASYNHTDIAFMQMMVPHHAQAIRMAQLAEEHADDPRVRTMADRIKAAQGPEILAMSAWLADKGVQVPTAADDPHDFDHSEHGHDPMVGMLTDRQLHELADARGTAFDRLFLTDMIQHHHGALVMARNASDDGEDVRVAEMAADVTLTQSAEIARMREMLRTL